MTNASLQFRVLGPLEVESRGTRLEPSAPRQRALLSLFLMHPREPLSVDRVIDELWGDEAPSGRAKTVGFHLSKLRDALEPTREKGTDGSFIRTTQAGYVLDVDPETIDSRRFESMLDDARAALVSDPGRAAALARDASSLWRGPAHADVAYEEFAQDEIRRLEDRRLETAETRIEADLALGRHAEVVTDLEGLVEQYPLREAMRSSLMVALYRSGRQADALRAYEAGRRMLAEELGIDPSRELQDLERRILEQDESLDLPGWAVPTGEAPRAGENPYKGLRSFDEVDAPDFFGRSALVADVLHRLDALGPGGLLALVGPSGSGKSSVLSAGLFPAVRRGEIGGSSDWTIARFRPGRRPMEELEVALLRSAPDAPGSLGEVLSSGASGLRKAVRLLLPDEGSAALLLVIDQFEELWTVADAGDREAVLAALTSALDDERTRLRVVIGLRSDFLGEPMRDPSLAERLRRGTILVPPLTAREIEEVVRRPAEGSGVAVDPDLTAAATQDLRQSSGALPLLQYALTRAFESRASTELLTRGDYEATGGIESALADGAEQAFSSLTKPQRHAARQLFFRLVSPGHGSADTRRRVSVPEIESLGIESDDLQAALSTFDQARLLTFDSDPGTTGAMVEVAHESLLTAWDRLASWIAEARDDLAAHRLLQDLVRDWEESGRDPESLLTGGRLARLAELADSSSVLLTDSESLFVAGSVEARDQGARRRRRQRRLVLTTISAIAVVAVVLAVVALLASGKANRQARQAEARALITDAYEALDRDPALSLFLAAAAAEIDPGTRAAGPLQLAIAAQTLQYQFSSPASTVAVDPDGRLLATLAGGGFVDVADVATGETIHRLPMQMDAASDQNSILGAPELELPRLAFDDSGRYIFGVSRAGEVRVAALPGAPAPQRARLANLGTDVGENAGWALTAVPGQAAVDVVAGDCTGRTTADGSVLTGLCVTRLDIEGSDQSPRELSSEPLAVTSASYIGQSLFVGTSDGVIDESSVTERGDPPRRAGVAAGNNQGAGAVSRDNRQVVVTLPNGSSLTLPSDGVIRALALDPSGSRLAVGHDEGTITVWDLDSEQRTARIRTTGGLIADMRLAGPLGEYVIVAISNRIEVHMVGDNTPAQRDASSAGSISRSALSLDGTRLALLGEDGSPVVIDTATGNTTAIASIDASSVAFDDGGSLLVGTTGGEVVWLQPATWQPERSIRLARPLASSSQPGARILALVAGPGDFLGFTYEGVPEIPAASTTSLNVVDIAQRQMISRALETIGGLENLGPVIPPPTVAAWHRPTDTVLIGSTTGGVRGSQLGGERFRAHAMRGAITQLVTAAESPIVLAVSATGAVAGLDFESPALLYETEVDPGGAFVAMDPLGRWLATGGRTTNTVELRDLRSGEAVATLRSGQSGILAVWFTPDASRLGFLDDQGRVGFVETHSDALLGAAHAVLAELGPPDIVDCATYFDRFDCSDAVTLP